MDTRLDVDRAADEGVREIQLSGKQLVFVFMATTVVAVVIFLCGVMVGLGVRPERSEAASLSSDAAAAASAAEPAPVAGAPAPPAGADDSKLTAASDLTRAEPAPVTEPTSPPPSPTASPTTTPAPSRAAVRSPTPSPTRVASPAPPSSASPTPAARPADERGDFTVQVAGLRERSAAEAMVKRLTTKGYAAFIVDPAADAPARVYRVRVGRYQSRDEAEQVAQRLEREERFRPFVTR